MTPGPTLIKQCSSCSKLIEQPTICSGNTFGATFWTDAKREAPMLPEQPWLVMCPHCNKPLWIDELEEVGEVESYGVKSTVFPDTRMYKKPSADALFSLIDAESNLDKKSYLRLNAWWAGNDARREPKESTPLSPREKSNLNEFAKMLDDEDENDRLMKAEILRELGQFDESQKLLSYPFGSDMAKVAEQIKAHALAKDSLVHKLNFD